jgi:hypothetical protein
MQFSRPDTRMKCIARLMIASSTPTHLDMLVRKAHSISVTPILLVMSPMVYGLET